MPTGYTADLTDDTSLATFVLRCARAFGALVSMRDAPMDAPIPDEFMPATHHATQIAYDIAAIERIEAMTDTDAAVASAEAFREATAAFDMHRKRQQQLADRYQRMLDLVTFWTPPTPDHAPLKAFMVEQLTESMRFDCGQEPGVPVLVSGFAWRARELDHLRSRVARMRGLANEEVERVAKRNAWVRSLRDSLTPKA